MKAIFACAISLVIVLLLGAVERSPIAASALTAQSFAAPKEFFRGKNVTLVLTTTPGASYDFIARLIAPKLKEMLAARAVMVENRGGGHVTATNYVYNRAKPDGLTWLHFAMHGRGWSQLMGAPGVEFDVRQFIVLGQFLPPGASVLMARGSLGLKTIGDVKNLKQFRVGTTDRYSTVHLLACLLFDNFDISNAKLVTGYKGSTETLLAMQRGEIEATAAVTSSSAMREKKSIDGGLYGLFTIYSNKRLEVFPDVPTALELGQWRADLKPWLESVMGISELQNTWVLPPGTPADRVAYLRSVFEELWSDAEIKKGLMTLFEGYAMFRRGSETEQLIKKHFPQAQKFSEKDLLWLRQLMDKWSSH